MQISTSSYNQRKWFITQSSHEIFLERPLVFRKFENWKEWGELQAKLILALNSAFPESHLYLRVHTYDLTGMKPYLNYPNIKLIPEKRKKAHFLYVCNAKDIDYLMTILSTVGIEPWDKGIFLLKNDILKCDDVLEDLFQVARKLEKASLIQSSHEFNDCYFFAHTIEENLVISKIDMQVNLLTGIIKKIANTQNLEIEWENKF